MANWRKLAANEVDAVLAQETVLLDFYSASCPPCRALEPRLEAFARHHPELTVLQVDIDANQETPQRFGVMSIPTLILFRDGQEVDRLDGLILDDDLERALRTAA